MFLSSWRTIRPAHTSPIKLESVDLLDFRQTTLGGLLASVKGERDRLKNIEYSDTLADDFEKFWRWAASSQQRGTARTFRCRFEAHALKMFDTKRALLLPQAQQICSQDSIQLTLFCAHPRQVARAPWLMSLVHL